jgi:hypothetical protein
MHGMLCVSFLHGYDGVVVAWELISNRVFLAAKRFVNPQKKPRSKGPGLKVQ